MISKKGVVVFGEKTEYIPTDRQMSGQPATIGSGVWMAPGCIVIQGVEIGENSVIGTGSVVLWDIPADTVVLGNPARPMRKLGG